MPKLTEDKYPTISFTNGEIEYFDGYAGAITQKKHKNNIRDYDRVTSEIGEAAVDFLLEVYDSGRKWMRGKFHYDFTNKDESIRLEVKTRKHYLPEFNNLDVRLDFSDWDNATESTHFVPVVFSINSGGAKVIAPGVFPLSSFPKGCEKNRSKVPPAPQLRKPAWRTTWGLVFESPRDYDFQPWQTFLKGF